MEQPVSAPTTQAEPQPTVVPSEADPLPREAEASVEAKAQWDPLPPAPAPAPPPPPPPAPPVERERPRKKRKLEEVGFHNFTYFKIRTILQNLRPSFLQVIYHISFFSLCLCLCLCLSYPSLAISCIATLSIRLRLQNSILQFMPNSGWGGVLNQSINQSIND